MAKENKEVEPAKVQEQDFKVLIINTKDYPRNITVNNEIVVLSSRSKDLSCYRSEVTTFDDGVRLQEVK
jgi:hypothetical protein